MSHPMSDADQSQAIEETDSSISMAELDDLLTGIQEDVEDNWGEWHSAIDAGELVGIHKTNDVLILSDVSGKFWRAKFDVLMDFANLIGVEDEPLPDVVLAAHQSTARRITDYNWDTENPVVLSNSGREQIYS